MQNKKSHLRRTEVMVVREDEILFCRALIFLW